MSTSTSTQPSQQQQTLDITAIPTPQLSQLQSRLSSDLEHLSTSHTRLRAAQTRFKDCIRCIADGVENKTAETPLLIPLTTSLYVPARPNPKKRNIVLVDVGTGYYVEKNIKDAVKFYEGKVDELRARLGEIERVVGGRSAELRGVEEVLRARVLSEQGQQGGQGGSGSGGGGEGGKKGE